MEEFEEVEFRARHRSLGNIRFIGELFKLKVRMYLWRASVRLYCLTRSAVSSPRASSPLAWGLHLPALISSSHFHSTATFRSHHAWMYYETAEVIFRWRIFGVLCQTDVHHWEGNGPWQDKGTHAEDNKWNSKQLCQTCTFPPQNLMEKYFSRVSHIIEARKTDLRVRFLLLDLVDLVQVRELQQPTDIHSVYLGVTTPSDCHSEGCKSRNKVKVESEDTTLHVPPVVDDDGSIQPGSSQVYKQCMVLQED